MAAREMLITLNQHIQKPLMISIMKTMNPISFSAAFFALAIFVCSAWLPAERPPIEEGVYFLQARHSGKYISVKNAGQENEAILWQWELHGKAQQQFELVAVTSDGSGSDDLLPANVRPAGPQYYTFTVTNKSMWDVSFRVLFFGARDWTSWTDVKAGFNAPSSHLTGEANQPIRSYEIQWKDIAAWKDFPGGMPIIPDNSSMNLTISGNTLTGIKID